MHSITIRPAVSGDIPACQEILVHSPLGDAYFSDPEKARGTLETGLAREQLHVAVTAAGTCAGFLWWEPNGAFHCFPYLHMIVVRDTLRGQGIGSQMLRYFEDCVSESAKKVFLVVADFNPDAKRLYERVGYVQVGSIPDLYMPGELEALMMKQLG